MEELDIWRAAELMIDRHGEDAATLFSYQLQHRRKFTAVVS